MRTAEARRWRHLRVALAVTVVALAGLVVAMPGTLALWTSTSRVSGTSITSGNVDLGVDGRDNDTAFAQLSLSEMTPGSSTAAVIAVSNKGASPLTYFVDTAASDADGKGLGSVLVVKVTGDAARSGTPGHLTCPAAALSSTGTRFGPDLVASTSPRPLAPGASEALCVQASLPIGATGASLFNATTNISFSFHASQVLR